MKAGQLPVTESQLERVIEELEVRCWERIQTIVKNEEGLGIEYDENVICDVCRSVSNFLICVQAYLEINKLTLCIIYSCFNLSNVTNLFTYLIIFVTAGF